MKVYRPQQIPFKAKLWSELCTLRPSTLSEDSTRMETNHVN